MDARDQDGRRWRKIVITENRTFGEMLREFIIAVSVIVLVLWLIAGLLGA